MLKLTLAQLRTLVELAEEEAGTGVALQPFVQGRGHTLVAAVTTSEVATAERWLVWHDGARSEPLGLDLRPLPASRARAETGA